MKIKSIIAFGVALIIGMTSCIHTQVDDNHDAFENAFLSDSQKEALSKKFASAFSYDNGSNHSNKVTVVNNTAMIAASTIWWELLCLVQARIIK